jgi:hypothetical protein
LRIILSLISVCVFAAAVEAQSLRSNLSREGAPARKARAAAPGSRYAKVELSDVAGKDAAGDKAPRSGRLISVMAEVLAYDARLAKLELFDARSRSVVSVSLAQVGRAERRALAARPATDVTVYGQVAVREDGQPVIVAHKLELIEADVTVNR